MTACEIDAPETALREEMILNHLPQVKLIAKRIHNGLPPSISLDDLVSAGVVGLIAAVDRYDPNQHVKLKTYAEYKIRGAILDSLRTLDWAPRQQRKRAKLIEAAMTALEQEYGRAPNEEEIARHLQLSTAEYQDWLSEARGLTIGSLETSKPDAEGADLLQFLSDTEEHWPSELLERAELQRLIGQVIKNMPKMEQTVLSLYFYEEMTLREIAKVVGLHESRISQLKSQAILRLRAHLEAWWPKQGFTRSERSPASAACRSVPV